VLRKKFTIILKVFPALLAEFNSYWKLKLSI